jgi:hypothetical protein
MKTLGVERIRKILKDKIKIEENGKKVKAHKMEEEY